MRPETRLQPHGGDALPYSTWLVAVPCVRLAPVAGAGDPPHGRPRELGFRLPGSRSPGSSQVGFRSSPRRAGAGGPLVSQWTDGVPRHSFLPGWNNETPPRSAGQEVFLQSPGLSHNFFPNPQNQWCSQQVCPQLVTRDRRWLTIQSTAKSESARDGGHGGGVTVEPEGSVDGGGPAGMGGGSIEGTGCGGGSWRIAGAGEGSPGRNGGTS